MDTSHIFFSLITIVSVVVAFNAITFSKTLYHFFVLESSFVGALRVRNFHTRELLKKWAF